MDYEQKYKEANEKVAARFGFNVAKEIFSDLYESEDERTRKEIILYLKSQPAQTISTAQYDAWLTWLEKQDEKNRWKPSEEQMKALKEAVDEHFDIDGGALWHLHEDLKKL